MTSPSAPTPKLPPELVSDWQALESRWVDGPLSEWRALLPEQFNTGLSPARYGDLPRWREAIAKLPPLPTTRIQLNTARVGISGTAPTETLNTLHSALMELHPWRKGPFELCGLHVDTEWRSDWKWERLAGAISPLEHWLASGLATFGGFSVISSHEQFDFEFFMIFLLPPIIFEAGFSMSKRGFFDNLVPILLYAVAGTLISTFSAGFLFYGHDRLLSHRKRRGCQ